MAVPFIISQTKLDMKVDSFLFLNLHDLLTHGSNETVIGLCVIGNQSNHSLFRPFHRLDIRIKGTDKGLPLNFTGNFHPNHLLCETSAIPVSHIITPRIRGKLFTWRAYIRPPAITGILSFIIQLKLERCSLHVIITPLRFVRLANIEFFLADSDLTCMRTKSVPVSRKLTMVPTTANLPL